MITNINMKYSKTKVNKDKKNKFLLNIADHVISKCPYFFL